MGGEDQSWPDHDAGSASGLLERIFDGGRPCRPLPRMPSWSTPGRRPPTYESGSRRRSRWASRERASRLGRRVSGTADHRRAPDSCDALPDTSEGSGNEPVRSGKPSKPVPLTRALRRGRPPLAPYPHVRHHVSETLRLGPRRGKLRDRGRPLRRPVEEELSYARSRRSDPSHTASIRQPRVTNRHHRHREHSKFRPLPGSLLRRRRIVRPFSVTSSKATL